MSFSVSLAKVRFTLDRPRAGAEGGRRTEAISARSLRTFGTSAMSAENYQNFLTSRQCALGLANVPRNVPLQRPQERRRTAERGGVMIQVGLIDDHEALRQGLELL